MEANTYYAHSLVGQSEACWHKLEEHLGSTADLARRFAEKFQSGEWARLAALWHDMGKYQEAFQARLRGERVSVDHSSIGAVHAKHSGARALPLAWVIAGHHAGLANWVESSNYGPGPLKERLERFASSYEECVGSVPQSISNQPMPAMPGFMSAKPGEDPKAAKRRAAFWIRMLFSTLVDADYLDTERFMDPDRARTRAGFDSIDVLWNKLGTYLDELAKGLSDGDRATPVNKARSAILSDCIERAGEPPGLFSLTAPTGGGKTLSSMAFAIRHAVEHGLERVLVVLPYTTIIEQNANVYREALGAANVLEHHANLTPERRKKLVGEEITTQHERAEENWDAPVIVTTTVQFFESLHANRPSRCRKLHRIARSVVILDEVQAVPPGLLLPIADALNELLDHYGCTIVLATATPPALTRRESFPLGLPNPTPILKDSEKLFRTLSRVRYHWPEKNGNPIEWAHLAERLSSHKQVLAVVDRRADAYELARLLAEQTGEPTFHLSTLMCPAHRLAVIKAIRDRLSKGEICRVVSTQLIEAGVNLDFPAVYRALTGLDHIVQAAGRCNREGRLERGHVYVFRPPKDPPQGTLRLGMQVTQSILHELTDEPDLDNPQVFERYFRQFYGQPIDKKNILREAQEYNFASIAERFKLIDDKSQAAVVCPYLANGDDDGKPYQAAISAFRNAQEYGRLTREEFRSLQPFIVQIYGSELDAHRQAGVVAELSENIYQLAPGYSSQYDSFMFGLILDKKAVADPTELVG